MAEVYHECANTGKLQKTRFLNSSTHSLGGWLGPTAGLDGFVEEIGLVPFARI